MGGAVWDHLPVRARLLVLLPVLAVLVGAAAFASGLFATTSHTPTDRSGVIEVDVRHLPVGGIKMKLVAIPRLQQAFSPLYVVRTSADQYLALFGRSPHLSCRVVDTSDPNYERIPSRSDLAFEDPCGGGYFTLSGAKVNGPSPRGLDRFPISVTNGEARIDLNTLIPGPPPPA
jgi:hypothetical protein